MAEPHSSPGTSESFDADEIYRQLGIFVVSFQYVESRLAEICWLLTEPPYADGERQPLAQLTYGQLVLETRTRITALRKRREPDQPEFLEESERVLDGCRNLGYLRNRIVHSAYVHLEARGEVQGIVRSNLRRQDPAEAAEDDVEFLGPRSLVESLSGMAQTAFALGQLQLQLAHWSP